MRRLRGVYRLGRKTGVRDRLDIVAKGEVEPTLAGAARGAREGNQIGCRRAGHKTLSFHDTRLFHDTRP